MEAEFTPYPKIPRLRRDCVVTEKIDGTNAAVIIRELNVEELRVDQDENAVQRIITEDYDSRAAVVDTGFGTVSVVMAQSRKKFVTPGKSTDNHGFAGWVYENAQELAELLGEGVHYGEWWGLGIQRGYNLDHKRFSLLNPMRYDDAAIHSTELEIDLVPVLGVRTFDTDWIEGLFESLRQTGSIAAPGFMRPEGIIAYHTAARQAFKYTYEHDDAGKDFGA